MTVDASRSCLGLATAFGGLPEALALHLGDHELQMRHQGFGAGGPGLRLLPRRALGRERRLQRGEIDVGIGSECHEPDYRMLAIVPAL